MLFMLKDSNIRGIVKDLVAPDSYNWEDMLQVARLAAWQATKEYTHFLGGSLKGYVCFKVRNSVIDAIRLENPKGYRYGSNRSHIDLVEFNDDYLGDNKKVDYDSYVYLTRVLAACEKLSNRHKYVLNAYILGTTMKEIGRRIGVTEGRVSQLLREAREFIR